MASSKLVDGEHMQINDGKTFEERMENQNKLINLVNYKRSVQQKVKVKNFIFRKEKSYLMTLI